MTTRTGAIALTAVAAVLLTGCATTSGEPAPASSAPASVSAEPAQPVDPVADAPDEESVDPAAVEADADCESLIEPTLIDSFADIGWTYQQQEFRIGAELVEAGFQCTWGDYAVATDHVQVFGWAPLTAEQSAGAQEQLLAEGWVRADVDDHTFVTEPPQFSIAVDEDGFGMTYEFGDGWVTVSDTRQGLLLITPPSG